MPGNKSSCPEGLAYFCMSTIEHHLESQRSSGRSEQGPRPRLRDFLDTSPEDVGSASFDLKQESPLFVTWNKRSFAYTQEDAPGPENAITQEDASDQVVEADEEDDDEEDQEEDEEEDEEDVSLRGCIGTFTALPLEKGLREYAITSAFRDTRFRPVKAEELPFLQCGVSLLTPMTPAPNPLAWTLGTHGIHITFSHSSRRYSGTYLPEVPPAQGWTKEETILSLIRKAGYRGKVKVGDEEDEVWGGIRLQTYESRKVKRNWAQFERWKAGNEK